MPIQANVTNNQITANVGETKIDVAVSGGIGPTGATGATGTVSVSAPLTNAGTSTAAVIGLATGTGLEVSGGSLSVQYGTSSSVACRGSDSRLSDSREWSAPTVTQAEAETGSSTDRKAFSPLRVFQAIAAWWAGSAAKTKLDGIASGATANQTDAYLLSRANHTGTQLASTISDFTTAVVAAAPPTTDASLLVQGTLPDARLSANIARTSDVSSAVAAVVGAAPASLDTLQELSAALANDANFASTVTNALAAKAPLASPTFTGTVSGITKAMVGLGNVDNTSDASKPISTATQTALDGKASLSHAHSASDITSGVLDTLRLPASVVYTLDARLSDARTPTGAAGGDLTGTYPNPQIAAGAVVTADLANSAVTTAKLADGSVTDAKITSGGLSTSSLNWAAIQPWAANTAYAKGDLVSFQGIAYRRSVAGTSGATFNVANWQQITPSEFVASQITSGTIATARLGSGTADATTFLRGDQTYAAPFVYATESQARTASSTNTVSNPARVLDALLSYTTLFPGTVVTASGGSASTGSNSVGNHVLSLNSGATANGSAFAYSGSINNAHMLLSRGVPLGNAWSQRRILNVRVQRFYTTPSANHFMRVLLGRNAATLGTLNAAGFGFEVRQSRIWLLSHNGTSLTETDSGVDFLNATSWDFMLESNGSGAVTLFRNGTSIATNNGGPTADSTTWCPLHYQVGNGGDTVTNIFIFGQSTLSYA